MADRGRRANARAGFASNDRLVVLGAAGGVLLALMSAIVPVIGIALAVLAVVGYLLFYRPILLLVLLIASNTVRWTELSGGFGLVFFGQKALSFAVLVVILARMPKDKLKIGLPLVAILATASVWTYLFSDRIPGVTPAQTVQSFATLSLAWLACSVDLENREFRSVFTAMAVNPVLSIFIGLAAGINIYAPDYTGAERLSGATIPAYFAFLTVIGCIGAVMLARSNPIWWMVAATNFGLAMLSGTRGAVICLTLILLPEIARVLLDLRRSAVNRGIGAVAALGGVSMAAAIFIPIAAKRSEVGGTFSSSGRTEAWAGFLGLADANPIFGRGIGAGPVASELLTNEIYTSFVAQHSEYVRLILETGYLGLTLFVGALLVLIVRVVKVQTRRDRALAVGLFLGLLVYSGTDNTFTDFQFSVPFGLLIAYLWSGGRGLGGRDDEAGQQVRTGTGDDVVLIVGTEAKATP